MAPRSIPSGNKVLKAGDTVAMATPGGGHGDPRERSEAVRASDIGAGYATPTSAE